MKRLAAGTVTDALMDVLEKADGLEHVLILYIPKEGNVAEGFRSDGAQTIAETIWMLERFKVYLLQQHCSCEEK